MKISRLRDHRWVVSNCKNDPRNHTERTENALEVISWTVRVASWIFPATLCFSPTTFFKAPWPAGLKVANSCGPHNTTGVDATRITARFPAHGYIGIAVIIGAEALLFAGNQVVGHWFTPIVWTGYILFVDALVYKLTARSLLITDRLEFVIIAIVSIAGWWLFEFYNAPRFWKSNLELWWHYHNLEPNPYLRRAGYDWAFATIFPAMFETAALLRASVFSRQSAPISIRPSRLTLILMFA